MFKKVHVLLIAKSFVLKRFVTLRFLLYFCFIL